MVVSLSFTYCSDDDNPEKNSDIVIGEWRAIQQFESDVIIDLPTSLQCIYITFQADNKFFSNLISSSDLPDECNGLNFELCYDQFFLLITPHFLLVLTLVLINTEKNYHMYA